MNKLIPLSILTLTIQLFSCSPNTSPVRETKEVATEETTVKSDTLIQSEANAAEDELRKFIISSEGTYGWETRANDISLDFFEDGRLHIQGPDGEATMWEGSWQLKGKRLSMVRPDLKTTETETASKDGEKLIIGAVEYTRYKINE